MMPAELSDVLCEIFTRLPVDAVFRCRSVCKPWRHIIDGESFVKFYTQNNPHDSRTSNLVIRDSIGGRLYSLSLDSLYHSTDNTEIDATLTKRLVKRGVPILRDLPAATCNGLIVLTNYSDEVIWNPLTRDFHKVPVPGCVLLTEFHSERMMFRSGFGYDHTTDDYKVVRVYKLRRPETMVFRTLIYTLKSGLWRKTAEDYTGDFSFQGTGVYLNGRLHFETKSKHGIVVFDLGTEEYRPLLTEPSIDPLHSTFKYLCVLGGCLVFSSYNNSSMCQKLWVMRDNGVEEGSSWVELFVIHGVSSGYLNPVAYMESKSLFILQRWTESGLLCVDIENKSVKRVKIDGLSKCTAQQLRLGSLFRLGNGNGGVTRKRKAPERLRFCVRVEETFYKVEA